MGCQNGGTCQIVERGGQERKTCRCPPFLRGVPFTVITGEKCERIIKRTGQARQSLEIV